MNVSSTIARFGLTKAFDHLYKDPENNLPQLMDWADKFAKGRFPGQRAAIRAAIEDPDNAYYPYVRHIIRDVDPEVVKTFAVNFFINANLISGPIQDEMRAKYNCNIPWAILLDPTSACNLHCIGCWEPLVRKKDLIRICEKHDDCIFLTFTNGTLIDEEFADEMLRVKNFVPAISLEGFGEATDSRRGQGVYEKVLRAMKILHERKLVYGISCCYTSMNYESITSEEYWDMMIENGAYFVWYFHYMPVGNDASPELLPSPEQRETVYRRIRDYRSRKPLFAMDFQNDAEFVGGCIAGGRSYLHINANGDADPCVFIHYSDSNIREKSLLDVMRSPLFMAYHEGQPFNDNMLQPCPMLENPTKLRAIIEKTGAKSTDMQSPETAEHLCSKCDAYAACWQPKAEELWDERKAERAAKKN